MMWVVESKHHQMLLLLFNFENKQLGVFVYYYLDLYI
jgi:hypothetical protein